MVQLQKPFVGVPTQLCFLFLTDLQVDTPVVKHVFQSFER